MTSAPKTPEDLAAIRRLVERTQARSVTAPDRVERVERLRALAERTVSPVDRALILAAAAELQSLRSALGEETVVTERAE